MELASAILLRQQTHPEDCTPGWLTKQLHLEDHLVRRMLKKIGLQYMTYPVVDDTFLEECRKDPSIFDHRTIHARTTVSANISTKGGWIFLAEIGGPTCFHTASGLDPATLLTWIITSNSGFHHTIKQD